MNKVGRIILQIAAVTTFSAALALTVNGVRREGLPLVMPFPPESLCPSRTAKGVGTGIKEALQAFARGEVLFVDARTSEAFGKGHILGAISVPYSFLEPVPQEAIERIKRHKKVIVYCNSKDAERSKLMAGELSESGVKGASYLEGGFWGWVRGGGRYSGQAPDGYEQRAQRGESENPKFQNLNAKQTPINKGS
jgi:rhodanese-related sulfurtransferase